MAHIGKMNHLQVIKKKDFGVYLDGENLGEILLPTRYLPENCKVQDWLDVFIYLDSNDLLIATTETPYVMVDQCAYLKVVDVNDMGAFLDWGLPKDLLVPYNQQDKPMQPGHSYVVFVYLDESTNRIAASSRLSRFLSEESDYFETGEAVQLLICGETELGYKAVINNLHLGLIYHSEVFTPLRYGQSIQGYIKNIRDDGKIDLTLQLPSERTRDTLGAQILAHLEAHGGTSTLTDKSPPEQIYQQFGVSKASYKKAIGALYKARLIRIDKDKISLCT